jgi:uncharacterized protein YcfJ
MARLVETTCSSPAILIVENSQTIDNISQGLDMKQLLFIALFAPAVVLGQQYAEVVRVEPRMVTTHEQQCQQIAVQRPATQGNAAGGVLGALAGAAIGNQIGGGSGKDIATAAGAVIGYHAGRGEPQAGGVEYRTVCEFRPVTQQRGETVTFSYRGRIFTQVFE